MSEELSNDEIVALSEKIEAFAAGLSDRERDAFAAALWAGEEEGEVEVEGFALRPIGRSFTSLRFTPGLSNTVFPSSPTSPGGSSVPMYFDAIPSGLDAIPGSLD